MYNWHTSCIIPWVGTVTCFQIYVGFNSRRLGTIAVPRRRGVVVVPMIVCLFVFVTDWGNRFTSHSKAAPSQRKTLRPLYFTFILFYLKKTKPKMQIVPRRRNLHAISSLHGSPLLLLLFVVASLIPSGLLSFFSSYLNLLGCSHFPLSPL